MATTPRHETPAGSRHGRGAAGADRRVPDHGPGAHPAADRLHGRWRPGPPAFTADVAAGVGSRAHRQPGRAVAAAGGGRPGARCTRRSTRSTTRSSTPAPSAPPCRCCRPPRHATTPVRSVAGCSTCSETATFSGAPLVTGGFAFGMIAQHEQQHDETMLITHQLRRGAPVLPAAEPPPAPPDALRLPAEVLVPGGPFTMGTSSEPWALDNERPAHTVDVAPFYLDTTPVTNGAYQQFIADSGYDDPRWWSPAGWDHRQRAGLTAPLYWRRDGGGWAAITVRRDRAGGARRAGAARVLVRGAGLRGLGAGGCPPRPSGRRRPGSTRATGRSRRYPWGDADPTEARANIGQRYLRPAPAGSYPGGGRAVRGAAADRGRLGVDRQRLPALPGLCRRGRTRSTRRSSSATSTRCCAAGRSRSARWPAVARSATGTTRSGGRSSPASHRPGRRARGRR